MSASSKLTSQQPVQVKPAIHINSVNGNANYETESVITADVQTESDESIDSD